MAAPPDPDKTLHVVGDIHHGLILQSRLDAVAADYANVADAYAHRVYIGDIVEDRNLGGRYDAQAVAWLAAVEPVRADYSIMPGNHDFAGGTRDGFAALFGEANWAKDLGFVRIVAVNPFRNWDETFTQTLQPDDLDWLDAQLAASDQDTLVFSHGSLYGTVGGGRGGVGSSTYIDGGPDYPDAEIRAILRARPHVRAWIGGHTHSHPDNAELVMAYPMADRLLAAINVGALPYLNPTRNAATDPLKTCFVSVYDDRIEVRHRDHLAQAWVDIQGQAAPTIPKTRDTSARFQQPNPLRTLVTFDGAVRGKSRTGSLTVTTTGTLTYAAGPWPGTQALVMNTGNTVKVTASAALTTVRGSVAVLAKLGNGSTAAVDDPYLLYHQSSGNRLYVRRSRAADGNVLAVLGDSDTQISGDAGVGYDEWVTVGLNWDGTAHTLFLDGLPVLSGTYSGFATLGATLSLGSADGILPTLGPLAAVASFNRPLSREEHARIADRSLTWTRDMLDRPRRYDAADARGRQAA